MKFTVGQVSLYCLSFFQCNQFCRFYIDEPIKLPINLYLSDRCIVCKIYGIDPVSRLNCGNKTELDINKLPKEYKEKVINLRLLGKI